MAKKTLKQGRLFTSEGDVYVLVKILDSWAAIDVLTPTNVGHVETYGGFKRTPEEAVDGLDPLPWTVKEYRQ